LCRNCLLKHVIERKIEGRIEVTERRGRRREQLLDDFKKNRGYWELKEEAIARDVWRTGCGRCCAPVVRQVWMNCKVTLCMYDVKKMQLVGLTSALQGRELEICPELLVECYC
jgi:hypothetical protein